MQILKLSLENAKRYESAEFTFTPGTNAIVGANGAGKSTILEAIGFALFDSMNYRLADFVREGAKSATVTVTIISDLDERRYEITRRCGSSNQYFAFDPELQAKVCEGKSDVISFLKEHMQVDPSADLSAIFADAVGVPQGTLTAAFLQTASNRKKAFDTLLQVEEYKEAADKLREPVRMVRDKVQELELALKEVTTRLERLPGLEEQASQRGKVLAEIVRKVANHQQDLDAILTVVEAQQSIQQKITLAQEQQRGLEQKQSSISREIDAAQKSVAEAQASQQSVAENLPGYDQYEAAQKEQAALNQHNSQRQQIETKRSELLQRLSAMGAEEQSLQRAEKESIDAAKVVEDLRASVTEQQQIEESYQQTERQRMQLESAQRTLAQQQERLVQLQNRATQLSEQLASREKLLADRQYSEKRLNDAQENIREVSRAKGQYQSEAEALKAQIASLQDRNSATCPVCEEPLSEAHRARLIERNEARLAELRHSYGERQQDEKRAQAEIESLQKAVQQLEQQLRSLPRPEELASLQSEIAEQEAAVKEGQESAGSLAAIQAEQGRLQEKLTALDNPRQRSTIAAQTAERREKISAEIENLTKQRQTVEAELTGYDAQVQAFAEVDQQLSALLGTMDTTRSANQAVLSNRQTAEQLEARQKRLAELEEEKQAAEAQAAKRVEEIGALTAQFDGPLLESSTLQAQGQRAQLAALTTEQNLFEREQQRDQQEIERLRKLMDEQAAALAERERLTTQSDALEMIRTYLRKAGPYITGTLIQQVSSGASEIFSSLMQDYSRHLSWQEDYGISLDVDGRERQFAQLSGGEQMSAALSVRLALLREMSNIDIAFFDEPTTNLDEIRRESLARQILEVKGFQQLFVISHDDTFEQSTENVIRVDHDS